MNPWFWGDVALFSVYLSYVVVRLVMLVWWDTPLSSTFAFPLLVTVALGVVIYRKMRAGGLL